MDTPSLKQFDALRQDGYRPQIVACFVHAGKVLFFLKKEYDLWMLPQGGIENQETLAQALDREMREELGDAFVDTSDPSFQLLGEDIVEFPPETQGSKDLRTDDGQSVFMRGKKYYFVAVKAGTEDITIEATGFDEATWLSYLRARDLAGEIYQKGKRRITLNALELLKARNLIQ